MQKQALENETRNNNKLRYRLHGQKEITMTKEYFRVEMIRQMREHGVEMIGQMKELTEACKAISNSIDYLSYQIAQKEESEEQKQKNRRKFLFTIHH